MKITDVKHIKTARTYANALFQSADEVDKIDEVYNDIVFINETIVTNEQLKNVLLNPVINNTDKKDIIDKIFSRHVQKITIDFMNLLIEKNRLDCFNEIVNCYNNAGNKKKNIITPVITSAVELDDNQKQRIIMKLKEKTHKNVIPEYSVNPDIIGGIIIETDDKTIDCSIKSKFDTMKKQLTKGNDNGNN